MGRSVLEFLPRFRQTASERRTLAVVLLVAGAVAAGACLLRWLVS
jgi:hypothetical protein